MNEKEVFVVLYKGKELKAWFGGDGTRIPVWELDNEKEAKAFLKNNKYHKPKLIKAKLIY